MILTLYFVFHLIIFLIIFFLRLDKGQESENELEFPIKKEESELEFHCFDESEHVLFYFG